MIASMVDHNLMTIALNDVWYMFVIRMGCAK